MMSLSASDLVRERVRSAEEDVHFPEALVHAVVGEYTCAGDVVLDPFAGYGTTLAVSQRMGRLGVGVELLPERVAAIRHRLGGAGRVVEGDARRLGDLGLGPVELWLTSPPYMSALDQADPLDAYRSADAHYPTYLAGLAEVFAAVSRLLRTRGHLVVNAANIRAGGIVTPLAWDIARIVAPYLSFRGESYLNWDRQPSWVSGDYCLVFQKS